MTPSPWIIDAPDEPQQLRTGRETDVVVIGAGFTGLSTAIALRDLGMDVLVLEQGRVGYGASGRNAGHLTPTIGKDLPTLVRLYGIERARELVALAHAAVAHVEDTITERAIACDYEPVGTLMAAVHERQHAAVDRAAEIGAALGVDGELLDQDALRVRAVPAAFTRAYHLRRGGILDPGKYLAGLLRVARDVGTEVFEETPVVHVVDGDPVVVETRGGRVRTGAVVLATNAFTPRLGRLRHTVMPVEVSLFRTAPLDPGQRAAIGWSGREGVYTAHEMLESYRLTADDRIVGGAKCVRYGFGGRLGWDDRRAQRRIVDTFHARFPALRDVAITERWTGPIAFALDFLPVLGSTGRWENIHYAVGFAGHGLALASLAGPMIADLVAGRDGPGWVLSSRRTWPLPPEPLRWLTVRGLIAALGWIDRRSDRAARHER